MLIRWPKAILMLILPQNCICVKTCSDRLLLQTHTQGNVGGFSWQRCTYTDNLNRIFHYVKFGLFLHLLILLKGMRGAHVTGHY